MTEEDFMNIALQQAEEALQEGEVPVGCVFVNKHNQILTKGHNQTNITLNGTQHAEIVAINEYLLTQGKDAKEFEDGCLYVSCEPCIMCAAAISKLKIQKVYFGCHNDRFGGNGSILSLHCDETLTCGSKYEVISGLGKEKAIEIFQQFYESENRRAPDNKRRKKA